MIEFAIGCNVTKEFKEAVAQVEESEWKPIYKTAYGEKYATGTEWAEVCYVPNVIGHSKKDPVYRYLAKREVLDSRKELPGMNSQIELPFPTMDIDDRRYKVFGIVTNMDWEGEKLIHWLHERCGKSEEAHAIMKDDLAGGKLPSEDFGENAAWWWIWIYQTMLRCQDKKFLWTKRHFSSVIIRCLPLPPRKSASTRV